MAVYWALFAIPVVALFAPFRLNTASRRHAWIAIGVLFAIAIGFRHEVGGDWYTYLRHFATVANGDFIGALRFNDPGYYGVGWLLARLGGDIYTLNLFCGLVVMLGVIVFAREQPLPWLALATAVPYLIVVVAMGYTRQSAALGFALLGFVALGRQRAVWFVFWVAIAALFHKSAMILMPFAALATHRHKVWTTAWVAATTAIGFSLLIADESERLWQSYVEADYQSQGGLIRVMMNAVPAVLFLALHRQLKITKQERAFWLWMSVVAIICIPLVTTSSAATDRAALYIIPLQMYVFSHLHRLAKTNLGHTFIVSGVVSFYALVLFIWLNYAVHAKYWVPYQFGPLQ